MVGNSSKSFPKNMNCISVGRNIVFPVVYCITGKSEHRISSVRNIGLLVFELLHFKWSEYWISVGRNIVFPVSRNIVFPVIGILDFRWLKYCAFGGWNIVFPLVGILNFQGRKVAFTVVGILHFRWFRWSEYLISGGRNK